MVELNARAIHTCCMEVSSLLRLLSVSSVAAHNNLTLHPSDCYKTNLNQIYAHPINQIYWRYKSDESEGFSICRVSPQIYQPIWQWLTAVLP